MPLTPDAKRLLAETIRGTTQAPDRGLRARLLRAIHDEADRRYRLSVPIGDAGLDEAHRRRRERIEAWIDERTRAAKPKTKAEEKETKARLLAQAEKEAAATFINRLVVLRLMEALGLSKPAVVTGGWTSKGYREFHEFGRTLCANGIADATEGYSTLLQLVFDELAVDLPGLFGNIGLTPLFPIPAATLRDVIETLDDPGLASAWTDETTLGWMYQFWIDFERDALDEKVLSGEKVEPHEIAPKTQMFTDRYIVEWLLQNSLGLSWLCMCQKHGWTPDANRVLTSLEARRAEWRRRRDDGEVELDALMPVESELEERWKFYVPQEIPPDAVANAQDSVRELRILDPAVGSGHFLVIAFDLLAALYLEEARHRNQPISAREIAESIIENNLHGIDIDSRAIQIAAASLYLKMRSFARDARPHRVNLVAPVLQLGNLSKDDPALLALREDLQRDVGIPPTLIDRLLDALAGVDHIGSLLKVDAAINDAIHTLELSFDNRDSAAHLPGRLTSAKQTLLERLETFLSHHSTSEDLGLRLDSEQLASGVRFVRMVREGSYSIVTGNPPYQALSKTSQFGYVAATYPRGKADLCAAFLERGLQLVRPSGFCAMVVMRGWMFLGQFAALRRHLLHNYDLRGIGDLDKGAFESMPTSQMISVAMAVFRAAPPSSEDAFALQPTAPGEKYWGSNRTELKRAAVLAQRGRVHFAPRSFSVIEGEPILYWWSRANLDEYASHKKLGEVLDARTGLTTCDNVRFTRFAWEPQRSSVNITGRFDPNARWASHTMGAKGRSWFEPLITIIDWDRAGLQQKVYQEHHYGTVSKHVRSPDRYFVPGIAFSMIGANFSARAHRVPGVFGSKGSSVFPDDIPSVLCLMNSRRARFVLESLNPGIGFEVGDVNRLPLYEIGEAHTIFRVLEGAFDEHERAREPSVEFRRPRPSPWRQAQAWAQCAVDRPPQAALPAYDPEFDHPAGESYLSFSIGVTLGRFDESGSGLQEEAPASALPGGILFVAASGFDSLEHPAAAYLHKTWDEYKHDISGKSDLRAYLRASFFAFHKAQYENRPIYIPLSSSKKNFVAFASIHRWQRDTLTTLLADHLVPTRRRLEGELDDLRSARAGGGNNRQAERRFTDVQRLLNELLEFIEMVGEIADRGPPAPDDTTPKREVDTHYEMDLNDGVMINSAALWSLVEPQWKEPKKWWKELATAKGKKDYDWSRLAARYFPTRVRKKCHDDPSLAVAHRCFWELHPAKAFAWELRLQDEIRPDFTIDEPGSDDARTRFLAKHELLAAEIRANEMKRRVRNAAKQIDGGDGPLFDGDSGDNEIEQDDGDD